MPRPVLTFARLVQAPENRAAWLAVQEVAAAMRSQAFGTDGLESRNACAETPLLMLHGPAGTGKTHLVHALAAEVTRQRPDLVVTTLSAGDLSQGLQATLFASEDESKASLQ